MAGYSSTPLVKKIGIKPGHQVALLNAPAGFRKELGEVPAEVKFVPPEHSPLDVVVIFAKRRAELDTLAKLSRQLAPTGMLWAAWPKQSSGVATDLSFDVVQKAGLALGLVDTKICAINEVWSGLKFVIRVKDRVKVALPSMPTGGKQVLRLAPRPGQNRAQRKGSRGARSG